MFIQPYQTIINTNPIEQTYIDAVQINGMTLQFFKEQTYELCRLAVIQNGMALEFVNEQSDIICRLAVQQTGLALQFVIKQFEYIWGSNHSLCSLAPQFSIIKIDDICVFAVIQNGVF